ASVFIEMYEPGLRASWVLYRGNFSLAFGGGDIESAVRELSDGTSGSPSLDEIRQDRTASFGNIVFQEHQDSIHVEYWPDAIRGETMNPNEWLQPDSEIETAINTWIARGEDDVVKLVRERSGSLD